MASLSEKLGALWAGPPEERHAAERALGLRKCSVASLLGEQAISGGIWGSDLRRARMVHGRLLRMFSCALVGAVASAIIAAVLLGTSGGQLWGRVIERRRGGAEQTPARGPKRGRLQIGAPGARFWTNICASGTI